MKKFDLDNRYHAILDVQFSYWNLKSYVENKNARNTFIHSGSDDKIISATIDDEKGVTNVTLVDYDAESFKNLYLDSIDNAFYYYSNQILIILTTYLEIIIQEFIDTSFYHNPNKIEKVKGGIISKIESIEKVYNFYFDNKLKNNLKTLIKHRNKIVHENLIFNVNGVIIDRIADNILSLLITLGNISLKNNIPIINNCGFCG